MSKGRGQGFQKLEPEEIKILQAFSRDTIVWPADSGLTDPEVKQVLESLKRKGLIHRDVTRGLTLTRKGKDLAQQHKDGF